MTVVIRPFTEDLIPAVKDFNARLTAGSAPPEFRFPERPVPDWLPKTDNRRLFQEYFVLLHNGLVRGAYVFKHQEFSFHGEIRSVGFWHWPISEGIVDKKYAWVGVRRVQKALKSWPLLYGLGFVDPLHSMLKALGWVIRPVPFYFRVIHHEHFLTEIQVLRKTSGQRFLLDLAARTGAGRLALSALQAVATKRSDGGEKAEVVRGFDNWADSLWNECKERYAMIAVRDSGALNLLYPNDSERFLCFRVVRDKTILGWAVLLDTQMHKNKYFGDLRLGSIVDCLALPQNEAAVIRCATRVLRERGVDLIVSNQSHTAWCAALRNAGYLRGPSNFFFGASQDLTELLKPLHTQLPLVHVTRGDGAGPIHL